jgi:hypothetical protein
MTWIFLLWRFAIFVRENTRFVNSSRENKFRKGELKIKGSGTPATLGGWRMAAKATHAVLLVGFKMMVRSGAWPVL